MNHLGSSSFYSQSIVPLVGTSYILIILALYYFAIYKRTKHWPVFKTISFTLGLFFLWVCLFGPLSIYQLVHVHFTAHMVNHLIIGMVTPLLIVFATPILLLLKALPTKYARIVVKLLHSGISRFLTHPIITGLLNIGGLWLIYTTPVYHLMHNNELLFLFVHVHVFITGTLFTLSIISTERYFQRFSLRLRTVVLVLSIAGHSILAKYLYAHPPLHVLISDAREGSMFMYYSGDVVHLLLIFLLCYQWYTKKQHKAKYLVSDQFHKI